MCCIKCEKWIWSFSSLLEVIRCRRQQGQRSEHRIPTRLPTITGSILFPWGTFFVFNGALQRGNYRKVAQVFIWLYGSYVTKLDKIKRTISLFHKCNDCCNFPSTGPDLFSEAVGASDWEKVMFWKFRWHSVRPQHPGVFINLWGVFGGRSNLAYNL